MDRRRENEHSQRGGAGQESGREDEEGALEMHVCWRFFVSCSAGSGGMEAGVVCDEETFSNVRRAASL